MSHCSFLLCHDLYVLVFRRIEIQEEDAFYIVPLNVVCGLPLSTYALAMNPAIQQHSHQESTSSFFSSTILVN